jgi:hypothetical protein
VAAAVVAVAAALKMTAYDGGWVENYRARRGDRIPPP